MARTFSRVHVVHSHSAPRAVGAHDHPAGASVSPSAGAGVPQRAHTVMRANIGGRTRGEGSEADVGGVGTWRWCW
jgi:hypothetical protein